MVFDDALQKLEPKAADLRKHLALMGNLIFQDVVERRNAVGGDKQQRVAQVVNIANLALGIGFDGNGVHPYFLPFRLADEPFAPRPFELAFSFCSFTRCSSYRGT